MEGAVTGMSAILANMSSIVTTAISWLGDYASLITQSGNELMFIFVALPVVGLGIGLLKRMLSV